MKIDIKFDGDLLTLTNEGLDNDNFVELFMTQDDGKESTMLIPVEDLSAAVDTFKTLQMMRLEREKLYE